MADIFKKLGDVNRIKSDINQAISEMGGEINSSTPFSDYADAVRSIPTAAPTDLINDNTITNNTTWSSNKINTEISSRINDIVLPTKLSDLTDDLGDNPVHTHSIYLTDGNLTARLQNYYNATTIDGLLANKQPTGDYATNSQISSLDSKIDGVEDKIPDVSGFINNAALNTALSDYYPINAMDYLLSEKQDTINDLANIRSGANLGATSLQAGALIDYATKDYVITEIEKIDIPDVSNFATKSELNNKQDAIEDLDDIRSGAVDGEMAYGAINGFGNIVSYNASDFLPSSTTILTTTDVDNRINASTKFLKKNATDSTSGVITFNGGSGGSNYGIIVPSGMSIGGITRTGYSQYATIRLVNSKVNTGSYYVDGTGSVLFRHKTGTASAEGTVNDAMLTIHPELGIRAAWSGTAGHAVTDDDLHTVLLDGVEYSNLTTTDKTISGAINELNAKPSGGDGLNNPYSLLEYKHSELDIINSSWLKSNGQWNLKAMYSNAYEEAKRIGKKHSRVLYAWIDSTDLYYTDTEEPRINDPIYIQGNGDIREAGYVERIQNGQFYFVVVTLGSIIVSRKPDSDISGGIINYTDYDFVYDEENELFRLPLKTKKSFIIDEGKEDGITYRIWNNGYCEQEGYINLSVTSISFPKKYKDNKYNILVQYVDSSETGAVQAGYFVRTRTDIGFTTTSSTTSYRNWKASGYLADDQYTPQKLYYYVGDTVQNASLIDVAQVTSQLANKVDVNSKVIDGQWKIADYTITSSGSAGTFKFNISDLIGNNTDCYEVLISSWFYSDSTTYRGEYISSNLCSEFQIGHNGTNNRSAPNSFIIPVGSDHIINFRATHSFTNREFKIASYRRLGTNE